MYKISNENFSVSLATTTKIVTIIINGLVSTKGKESSLKWSLLQEKSPH